MFPSLHPFKQLHFLQPNPLSFNASSRLTFLHPHFPSIHLDLFPFILLSSYSIMLPYPLWCFLLWFLSSHLFKHPCFLLSVLFSFSPVFLCLSFLLSINIPMFSCFNKKFPSVLPIFSLVLRFLQPSSNPCFFFFVPFNLSLVPSLHTILTVFLRGHPVSISLRAPVGKTDLWEHADACTWASTDRS